MSMSRRVDDRSIYDRRHGPAVTAAGDGLEGAYGAILNTAPSNGTVKVIVPNLWGLTEARTAVCPKGFTGNPGDQALVVFDETKTPWIVSPPNVAQPIVPTTLPPSGPAGGVLGGSYPNPGFASGALAALGFGGASIDYTGTFAISSNTFTAVPCNVVNFDTTANEGMTATANRLTAPASGLYIAVGWINYTTASQGLETNFRVNGTTYTQPSEWADTSAGSIGPASTLLKLNAGDYVELVAFSDVANTVHVGGLQMARLG